MDCTLRISYLLLHNYVSNLIICPRFVLRKHFRTSIFLLLLF
nr:MAG TPA: hypothetical protein [Caudoviricetes sp.]